jgi:hypothetical protein
MKSEKQSILGAHALWNFRRVIWIIIYTVQAAMHESVKRLDKMK